MGDLLRVQERVTLQSPREGKGKEVGDERGEGKKRCPANQIRTERTGGEWFELLGCSERF